MLGTTAALDQHAEPIEYFRLIFGDKGSQPVADERGHQHRAQLAAHTGQLAGAFGPDDDERPVGVNTRRSRDRGVFPAMSMIRP